MADSPTSFFIKPPPPGGQEPRDPSMVGMSWSAVLLPGGHYAGPELGSPGANRPFEGPTKRQESPMKACHRFAHNVQQATGSDPGSQPNGNSPAVRHEMAGRVTVRDVLSVSTSIPDADVIGGGGMR